MIEELMKCDLKLSKNGIISIVTMINRCEGNNFTPRRFVEKIILNAIDKKYEQLSSAEYCHIQNLSMEIYLEINQDEE